MSGSNICLTPQCITTAASILQNLHPNFTTIDPCTSFDQYVCGGYAQRFAGENVHDRNQESNIHIIRTILEGDRPPSLSSNQASTESDGKLPAVNDDELEMFETLLQNHASCMNETAINATGIAGISSIISNLVELFPLADGYASNATMKDEDLDAFAEATAYLASVGVSLFGDFSTFQDMENPNTLVPWYTVYPIYRPDRTLPEPPKSYTVMAKRAEFFREALLNFMPEQDISPQLVEGIMAVVEAIAVIEKAIVSDDDLSIFTETWHMSTVAEASRLAPALVIDKVINKLAPEGYRPDRMMLSFPSVYSNLSDVVASSPKAVLQALMILRIAEHYVFYVNAPPTRDRMKDVCFDYLDQSTPWLLGKFFLDKTYSDKNHQAYISVAESVKDALVERMQTTSWLSGDDRILVTEKARRVQLNVGYPEENPDARNATSLKEYYAGANITDSWFDNVLSLRQWDVRKSWDALLHPVSRLKWREGAVHPYIINARASREENMIMMPASLGILPFFDPGLPLYSQYGRTGFIIGHEIVHNFDPVGLLISNEGTTKDWLSAESAAAFSERADCIREQYSRVPVVLANGRVLVDPQNNKTLHVNGDKTTAENIADQGGISAAYEAWQKAEAASAGFGGTTVPQLALPGLECFSREQLFFITFGQTWCRNPTEEIMRNIVAVDDHAPAFARARMTVMNVEGFKKAWQCKDPAPVCKVW